MRILIATAHRNLTGGVEKYLQVAAAGLCSRGHELALLYEYAASPEWEKIDPPEGWSRAWCLAEEPYNRALTSIAEWHPEIVYYHGFGRMESLPVEDALLKAYPVALYAHNHDRTCGTGQKCFMFPHPEVCGRKIGPMCLLLHYPRRCGGLHPANMWRTYQKHTALSARLPQFRAVLAASDPMRRELAQHGVHPEKLHLATLPATGVVAGSLPPVRKPTAGNILFVGRLTNLKGADYLVRALPLASRQLGRTLTLTVAGDGPELGKLKKLARDLNVTAEFRGWVNSQDKLELMRKADLLAMPSVWPEPFGLVGLEAGAVGLPAAGFAVGGVPDWLIPGQTGELAPGDPPTADGLANAIAKALRDPDHYGKLSRGAWELSRQFSLERHIENLEAIFAGCMQPAEALAGVGGSPR